MNKYLVVEQYLLWARNHQEAHETMEGILEVAVGLQQSTPRNIVLLSAPPRSREPQVGDVVRISSCVTPDPDLGGEREGVVIEAGLDSDDGDCEVIFRVFATEWIQRTINKAVLEVVNENEEL